MGLDTIKVRVTKGELEEFKKSLLWADIRRELYAWKKGFETELRSVADNVASTNPSTASVLMHIGDITGRIKTVDYLLSLPDVFIQIIESDNTAKAEEEPINEPREE